MTGSTFSRRRFLEVSGLAGGGLVLGFYLPERVNFIGGRVLAASTGKFAPNAFLRIAPDDAVTVIVGKSEMGQGVFTSLAMVIAEELDSDWSKVRVEASPAEPAYNHPAFGVMLTGGSTSVNSSWQQFRSAGATARAMLLGAAAAKWSVDRSALRTENGTVVHDASGRRARYGELAEKAAALPVPENTPLKDPKDFRIIGTDVKRIEGPDKVTGQAGFSMDVRLPGMLTAVVAHPPVFGAKLKSFDDTKARALPGVSKVKRIGSGVAVLAKDFWTARTASEALQIEWEQGEGAALSTASLREQYRALADEPGAVAENEGDALSALGSSAKTLEAVYEVPYLAHAPMEPLNATVHAQADGCDIWAGTQFQTMDQMVASKILGIPQEKVRVHTTFLGGGFGRRATPSSDFVTDALEVAKDEGVPVKTVWLREDDIQGGYYRPMFVHKVRAGLDRDGLPVAWHQTLVGQSILSGTAFASLMKDGIDSSSVEGAAGMPYAIPHRRIELHSPKHAVTVLWWRSVGHTHTGFVNESFLDEVAHAGGKDPFELRRKLLANHPRHLRVLELAAEKAGWGSPLPEGRARGIAVRQSFETYVAEVAEVSIDKGKPRVHRVVCAVDCGIAVNPWNAKAQMEGGIAYGLSAALYGEITLDKGRSQQSNFHDYVVLRMDEMPKVDVHIVPSEEHPTGCGEPGVPPLAPAVTNALFALTGKRIRKLPIRLEEAVEV